MTPFPLVRADGEGGFTLIELLVVLVILPLLIGGIAEAMIVSFNSESANSAKLSDTENAQIAQDNFVRDVQGASYITTSDNSGSNVFFSNSPKVCSPGTGADRKLLVAFYHPAEGPTGSAFDVAYWLEPSSSNSATSPIEIDRYSCSLDSSFTYTTAITKEVIAEGPPGSSLGQTLETISALAEIQPSQFAIAASQGWILTDAFTTAVSFSGGTLTVGSTAGFSNGNVTVQTTAGSEVLTACVVSANGTTFTGCSSPTGTLENGDPVTQSNVSTVQLSVTEPASSYHFSLNGVPRPVTPEFSSTQNPPTLLTLGNSGINPGNGGGTASCPPDSTGTATANICIGTATGNGSVVVDSNGSVLCNGQGGHQYIHFQNNAGTVESVAPTDQSSCNKLEVVGDSTAVPDPLQNKLPNGGCMPSSFVTSLPSPGINPLNGANTPGIYTTPLSGSLEPGVYVVEGGLGTVTPVAASALDPYFYPVSSAPYFSITKGKYDANAGVLLFVPAEDEHQYLPQQGCYVYNASPGSVSPSVTAIGPLDASQSSDYFSGDSALGDFGVWLWQDATNTTSLQIPSNSSYYSAGGLLYAPGATLTFNGTSTFATGSAYLGGVSWNGTDALCLNWPSYAQQC